MHLYKHIQATFISLSAIILLTASASAQDPALAKQLEQSHYLRNVMKVDPSNAGMTRWIKKKAGQSRILPLAEDFHALKNSGPGTIQINHHFARSGTGSILLETPSSLAVKNPSNRSYAFAEMIRPLKGENLAAYNRFLFGYMPMCPVSIPFLLDVLYIMEESMSCPHRVGLRGSIL